MRTFAAVAAVLGSLLSASLALGQEPAAPAAEPAPAPPPAQISDSPSPATVAPAAEPAPAPPVAPAPAPAPAVYAPPPPVVDRAPPESTARQHSGFYFALRAGPSYFSATSDFVANTSEQSRSFSGPSTNFVVALGGTLRKSPVILGGTLSRLWIHSLSGTDENGNDMDLDGISFALISAGFLCDVYFGKDSGWHAFGNVGLSVLEVEHPTIDYNNPTGPFLMAGAGYDWWIADGLLVGVLGQLGYYGLEVSETGTNSTDVTVLAPGLALNFVVN